MKKRLLSLLLLCTLVFALSGCGEKTLLNKKKPVSLSFWHVYGEQAGSPMDLLVQEFNRTVGQERGVQVKVTGMSSAAADAESAIALFWDERFILDAPCYLTISATTKPIRARASPKAEPMMKTVNTRPWTSG